MIIDRVGQPPFEIKRGDRVSYKGQNMTVKGVSKARGMVRIEADGAIVKGGFWVDYRFVYPPLPEEIRSEGLTSLDGVVASVNSKNEPADGWDEKYKVEG